MKAEAVNAPSTTASVATGKNNAGTDSISSGDFLMALMGLLQQQGGTENKGAGLAEGMLQQDGGANAGLGASKLAELISLYPQGMFPGAGGSTGDVSEGSARGSCGNVSSGVMPLYQLESVLPLINPVTVIDGQTLPEFSIPGGNAYGQPADGTISQGNNLNLQSVAGFALQDNTSLLQTASGVPVKGTGPDALAVAGLQLLNNGEGVNSQTQTVAGRDNSTLSPGLEQTATIINNAIVQDKLTVMAGKASKEAPVVVQAQSAAVRDQSQLNGFSRPNNENIPGKEETAVNGQVLQPIETKHSKNSQLGGQENNAGAGNSAAEQLAAKGKTIAESCLYEKTGDISHEARRASEVTGQSPDSGGEDQSVSITGGSEVKDYADTRTGALGQTGEIQAGPTHIANINGRRLAAEIMTYVMNVPKNTGGENSRVTTISLKLEPENLGEIKIKLSFAKGELTAHFFTASGLVKDAVEGSLPQLRETLSQHNINLGEATAFVGQEQHGNGGARHGGYNWGGSTGHTGFDYQDRQPGDTGSSGNEKSSLDMLI